EDLGRVLDLGVLRGVDVLDLAHVVGLLVELCPLVVGDVDRDTDLDGLDDVHRVRGVAATTGEGRDDLVLDALDAAGQTTLDRRVGLGGGLGALLRRPTDGATTLGDAIKVAGGVLDLRAGGRDRLVAGG